jgi:hypothetical protein
VVEVVVVVGTEVWIGAPGEIGEMTDGAADGGSTEWVLVGPAEGTSPKFGIWRARREEAEEFVGREDSEAEARRESTIQVAAATVPALTNIRVTKVTARVRRCRVYRGRTPSGEDRDIWVHSTHRLRIDLL